MRFLIILLALPISVIAQLSVPGQLTGTWVGQLYNDTTKQYHHFEIALDVEKKRPVAYSYTTFLINGQSFVGVKSIKARVKDENVLLEDDDLIFNDYPQPPSKGVRFFATLSMDTNHVLNGTWKTNATREYNALTGTLQLVRKADYSETRIIPKLEELGLAKNVSFWIPNKRTVTTLNNSRPVKQASQKDENVHGKIIPDTTITEPEMVIMIPSRPAKKEEKTMFAEPVTNAKEDTVIETANSKLNRKIETIRTVEIQQDSLVLSLYDNGTVDGDTVSILLNKQIIISRLGLTSSAYNKTIFLTPEMGDTLELIMYAENLGGLPPNTGLLIVRDGSANHEIRFSGDLTKNSAIILKRKTQHDK